MAQAARTFRIFVSSTFEELKEQPNRLQKDVFPKLKELCLAHRLRRKAITPEALLHRDDEEACACSPATAL